MEFITNYWVIILVAFILFLLVLLSYLIDKEIRKMKDDNIPMIEDDNYDTNVSNIKTSDNDIIDAGGVNEIDTDTKNEFVDETRILDYDELDVEDIEDDFNKVIHKKKIIDSSIMDSVEAMHVDSININNDKIDTDIVLPEIRIKKDMNEDIW